MATRIGEQPGDTSPQAILEEAVALQRRGDYVSAIKRYKTLLKQVPDHPQILNFYAMAAAETGNLENAAKMVEKAVKSLPGYADAWINLGLIRQKLGDLPAAADAYGKFSELQPRSAAGYLNLGNIRQLQNRYGDALPAYEKALAINPDDPAIWSNYARAALYAGDWNRSLDAADRTLALSKGHTGALAVKSAALLELGREEELANLVDFNRLIDVRTLAAPEGYTDLKAFNQALCTHCQAHPSLIYEPSENTTKKGHQTGNLSKDEDQGPVAHLLEMIDAAVREYQEARPSDDHSFLANRPARWSYDIWATILGSQGHQAPHIHRSGWLSGCYYAKIPEVIAAENKDQAGWIEFGRPQDHPHAKAEAKVRAYQPHEGMIVLFPSYFYHRTVPFESEDQRISIAFDIVPSA